MKTSLSILILAISVFQFACNPLREEVIIETVAVDTLLSNPNVSEEERLERRKRLAEKEKIDSLNLELFLSNALKIAEHFKDSDKFTHSYTETMPDSSCQVDVTVQSDFYFTEESPHLIIRRTKSGLIYIDIFTKKNNLFQRVLSHEEWNITYLKDTIQDVNGDGLKDFLINGYGSNGCCLKAYSDVFLLRPDKKTFSSNFQFINPTFSSKEQIIRGICYGHIGHTEMYKYKWNGDRVDTLEYISYEKDDQGEKTGMVIVSDKRPFGKRYKILKRLPDVPNEYKIIEGYSWFSGEGYQ